MVMESDGNNECAIGDTVETAMRKDLESLLDHFHGKAAFFALISNCEFGRKLYDIFIKLVVEAILRRRSYMEITQRR